MECYEKGLISKEEVGGLDLRFGNADAMVKLVEMAGAVDGDIGVLAANGVKKASEKIGKGSENFAMHVKGLEIPAYDPRAAQGMGLNYAIGDRGACHLHAWTAGDEMLQPPAEDPKTTKGKARSVKDISEDVAVGYDSAGTCLFQAFGIGDIEEVVGIINAATGFGFKDVDEFRKTGERILNLTRSFNIREGFSRKDDTLPYRCLKEPLPDGSCKGMVVKLDEMLDDYYSLCGWDNQGKPTQEKLKELGLDHIIKELY
jgi:aldehyde:ferredoxin oxidoreductase